MKSYAIERSANTVLDLQCMPGHALLDEQYFATIPLVVAQPATRRYSETEEELYALFEDAISDRVERVSRQLSRISLGDRQLVAKNSLLPVSPTTRRSASPAWISRPWLIHLPAVRRICLGIGLLLLGFDLMGLLVLLR